MCLRHLKEREVMKAESVSPKHSLIPEAQNSGIYLSPLMFQRIINLHEAFSKKKISIAPK